MLRVLLVCTGNICRSPIAHAFLLDRLSRRKKGSFEVRSAGTHGRSGYPATPEAVAAAAERGIDIAEHRSSRLSPDLVTWADIIVTMTIEQAELISYEAPDASPRTFTLKELVAILRALPAPVVGTLTRDALLQRVSAADRIRRERQLAPADMDVADPLGLSETVYRAVAAEIEGLVDDLVEGLTGGRNPAVASGG
ncbi:MAG: hypothetical protein ACRDHM_11090 [Actinomycetota bacterium]